MVRRVIQEPQKQRVAALALLMIALSGAAPGAAAAQPSDLGPAGTIFGGVTSQGNPVALIRSRDQLTAVRLLMHVDMRCANGSRAVFSGPMPFKTGVPGVVNEGENVLIGNRISPTGRLRVEGLGSADYGPDTGALTDELNARLSGSRLRGTLRIRATVINRATGTRTTTCTSGFVRLAARVAPGRIFAGLTSHRHPVVVRLSADRRTVSDFFITWGANCQPTSGGFLLGHRLVNFPIAAGGRFGDDFETDPQTTPAGNRQAFRFSLRGRVGRKRATGTLAATLTESDPSGTTTATCVRRAHRWSADS